MYLSCTHFTYHKQYPQTWSFYEIQHGCHAVMSCTALEVMFFPLHLEKLFNFISIEYNSYSFGLYIWYIIVCCLKGTYLHVPSKLYHSISIMGIKVLTRTCNGKCQLSVNWPAPQSTVKNMLRKVSTVNINLSTSRQ